MSECQQCGAQAGEMSLCAAPCGASVADRLREVPDLLTELDITRSRQDRLTSPYDRSRGRAGDVLPFKPRVAEVSWVLANTLRSWASEVATPDTGVFQARGAAAFLLDHLDRLRAHAQAGQAADEITYAVRRARDAIDRHDDPWLYLGPCDTDSCHEQVYGLRWRRTGTCRACGAEYDIAARQERLRDLARAYRGTADEIASFLRRTGMVTVTRNVIVGYARRGRLEANKDADGCVRFSVDDVLTAIERRYRRHVRDAG